MTGFISFLVGAFAIILTYLFGKSAGKHDTETRIKGEVTISRQQVEKAEAERDAAVMAAGIASRPPAPEVATQYSDMSAQIQEARASNDESSLRDIAAELARQMVERHNNR